MLNREPMGMKHLTRRVTIGQLKVSVLNREPMGMKLEPAHRWIQIRHGVSVLNREPMGMKPDPQGMTASIP